jgi:hypothetical protein
MVGKILGKQAGCGMKMRKKNGDQRPPLSLEEKNQSTRYESAAKP